MWAQCASHPNFFSIKISEACDWICLGIPFGNEPPFGNETCIRRIFPRGSTPSLIFKPRERNAHPHPNFFSIKTSEAYDWIWFGKPFDDEPPFGNEAWPCQRLQLASLPLRVNSLQTQGAHPHSLLTCLRLRRWRSSPATRHSRIILRAPVSEWRANIIELYRSCVTNWHVKWSQNVKTKAFTLFINVVGYRYDRTTILCGNRFPSRLSTFHYFSSTFQGS